MKRLCYILALTITLSAVDSIAQENKAETYFYQDSLIKAYSEQSEFSALLKMIDRQLVFLEDAGYADSAYKYTYPLGLAISQVENSQSAIDQTEAFVTKIMKEDPNISHQLVAINDLMWVYLEAGVDSMCLVTDMRYYDLCQRYPNASPQEKYIANYSLGFDYEYEGQSQKAIYYFTEAIDAVISDSLTLLTQVMDGYNGLGAAYWRNGNLDLAKKAFSESIRFSLYSTDSLEAFMYQANAIGNMSLVFEDEGNLVKCKELLEHALHIRHQAIAAQKEPYQKKQQRRQLIGNYHNLSELYLRLGDLERARKAQEYCKHLRKLHFPPEHRDHAKSYEAFGSINYAQGNYQAALNHFEEGLEQLSIGFGETSPYIIAIKERLGKTHLELGHYSKSVDYLSEAVEACIAISDEATNQELAMAYFARSNTYFAMGELDLAEQDLFRAQAIFDKTRDASNYMFGQIYLDLAAIKESKNELDSADYYLNAVLSLGSESANGLNAKYSNRIQYLPAAYGAKALLVKKRAKPDLKEALKYALQGKEILRTARQSYQEDFSQLALYEQQSDVFDIAIDITFELYKETDNDQYLELLLQLAEESNSILLRNQLNKFSSLRVNNVPDSLLIQEGMLMNILSGSDTEATPDKVFAAEKDYELLVEMFESEYPAYYALRYNEKVATTGSIQKELLENNQNLIEYIVTDSGTYALVINPNSAIAISLETADIQRDIARLNALITEQSPELFSVSHLLYERLFAPLEKHLKGNEIVIVADKGIFNINFEALTQESDSQNPKYLIESYNISYLLSSTTALQFDQLEKTKNTNVLAFAPGFTDRMKDSYLAHLPDSVFVDDQYLTSIQQPFSVSSAEAVASLFSGTAMVTEQATESNFKELAEQYSILHLSTHTKINNLSPLMSKFIMSKPNVNGVDQDGYLHAYEIYNLPLRAELAVLTACETGIGKETSSEGVLSIAHSFAYAGCPSIVMSIWQIDEKTSAEIVASFYSHLKNGEQKNIALRQAKLEYLQNNKGELAHPYYWSGLVLVGNTEPISVVSSFPWLVVGMSLLALVLILAVLKRMKMKRS